MTNTLKCAVLTKSALRETATGRPMFSMTVSDFDTTSTIKIVCFDKTLYRNFDTATTYDISHFRIKKSLANYPEIHINDETKIHVSLFQFSIERKWFTVSQILRNETQNIQFINLKAKILQIEDAVKVGKYPNIYDKREIQLADHTGTISLVLWREKATSINFEEDDVLSLENMLTSKYRDVRQLNSGPESIFTVIDEEITPLIPPCASSAKRPSTCTQTISTTITAIKEFTCSIKCINCKNTIKVNQTISSPTDNTLLTCESCSTSFLPTKFTNDCKILLAENNQWFSCSSGVSKCTIDLLCNFIINANFWPYRPQLNH